ncbi:hypothetical protein H6P81_017396 [Aristolochia fimbriata]|uniref:WD repeat-containing protein 74 n=1 Tax=Aristolochia fimbriata TaxID=158543 RepID=A0AAV7E128_ARIFI|nr:hypothetical protein H6P81_017396 [Aristolochia fimbriata]
MLLLFATVTIKMPHTSAVESPGCPPLRALTFDVLGLGKVVEARVKQGIPSVVERWGDPDPSRCALVASLADNKTKPLVAVGRKNGLVEVLNPLNGDVQVEVRISEAGPTGHVSDDDLIVGLHLFKGDSSSKFLACTVKGNASLRSTQTGDASASWKACDSGKIACWSVDYSEKYALFGGKGVEVNVWDLANSNKIWTSKFPPANSLGIFTPTWFTAGTFLSKDDHRKIVAGTNNHQVRLYDIAAQRRPVISVDFRESPIRAVTAELDGYTIYAGTACGDLASFDMRTGKLLGCFVGKCCGSIRSIARHPEHPLIASCGLDAYLRFWDTKTRKPLAAVFLKQHLTSVVIDGNFTDEVSVASEPDKEIDEQVDDDLEVELENYPVKRKHSNKQEVSRKKKSKKSKKMAEDLSENML